MLRTLLAIIVIPTGLLVGWLALGERSRRADFAYALGTEPRTLDPHRASWLAEIQLAAALFEGLTRLNADTFLPEPAAAERWDVAGDGRTYTFHLRPDLRWSNGDALTAEDFRFGWLRVLHPDTEAQYANLLFVIAGAEGYYRSRLNATAADDLPDDVVGIEVVDARTLRVSLASPCSYFLDLTSFITLSPAHRPTLRRWAYRDGRVLRRTQHLWLRPGHIVCNGAFVLTEWDFKERILLERNGRYWDAASLGVETIEALSIPNPNSALIAYETGRIDHMRWLERSVAEVLQASGRTDFVTGDRFATQFFRVNCTRPPLDDPDFRTALYLAIDRAALCRHVMRLGETPAPTLVPRTALRLMPRAAPDGTTICYEPPAGLGEGLDPAEREALAREHLARSGFANARAIEIAFPSDDPEQRSVSEAVQAMWERVLGIRVELRTVEGKVLSSYIRGLDYDVARSNWFGDYMDPSTFLDLFVTGSGQNRTGWSNDEYDRLITAAAAEADNARRYALFTRAEQILCVDELPILPLYYRRGNYLLREGFAGVRDNVRDLLQLHRVRRAGG